MIVKMLVVAEAMQKETSFAPFTPVLPTPATRSVARRIGQKFFPFKFGFESHATTKQCPLRFAAPATCDDPVPGLIRTIAVVGPPGQNT